MSTKIWDMSPIPSITGNQRIPVATGPSVGDNAFIDTSTFFGPVGICLNGSDNNGVGNYPIDGVRRYITNFWGSEIDTNSGWNFTNASYTVPVSGFYVFKTSIQVITNDNDRTLTGGGCSVGVVVLNGGVDNGDFDDRSQYTQATWGHDSSGDITLSAMHALYAGDVIRFSIAGVASDTGASAPGLYMALANSHLNIRWIRPLSIDFGPVPTPTAVPSPTPTPTPTPSPAPAPQCSSYTLSTSMGGSSSNQLNASWTYCDGTPGAANFASFGAVTIGPICIRNGTLQVNIGSANYLGSC